MVQRIEIKDITVPAGVPRSFPSTFNLTWRLGYVQWVEIRFPPGTSGLVGVKVHHSGQRVIPHEDNNFIVTDNEIIKWEIEGFPSGSAWSVRAYNTDIYDHTIQTRWGINELTRQELTAVASTLPQIANVSSGALGEGIPLPDDLAAFEVTL